VYIRRRGREMLQRSSQPTRESNGRHRYHQLQSHSQYRNKDDEIYDDNSSAPSYSGRLWGEFTHAIATEKVSGVIPGLNMPIHWGLATLVVGALVGVTATVCIKYSRFRNRSAVEGAAMQTMAPTLIEYTDSPCAFTPNDLEYSSSPHAQAITAARGANEISNNVAKFRSVTDNVELLIAAWQEYSEKSSPLKQHKAFELFSLRYDETVMPKLSSD
jgi:hypothetical protein